MNIIKYTSRQQKNTRLLKKCNKFIDNNENPNDYKTKMYIKQQQTLCKKNIELCKKIKAIRDDLSKITIIKTLQDIKTHLPSAFEDNKQKKQDNVRSPSFVKKQKNC